MKHTTDLQKMISGTATALDEIAASFRSHKLHNDVRALETGVAEARRRLEAIERRDRAALGTPTDRISKSHVLH